jgi:DNA-binding cell septation regulator SpoVG
MSASTTPAVISNITIFPVSGNDKVKANAYLTVANMFKIKATIMQNDKGMFVSFPGRYYKAKDGTEKWASDVETVNKEVTKTVSNMLIEEYKKFSAGGVKKISSAAKTTSTDEDDEPAF